MPVDEDNIPFYLRQSNSSGLKPSPFAPALQNVNLKNPIENIINSDLKQSSSLSTKTIPKTNTKTSPESDSMNKATLTKSLSQIQNNLSSITSQADVLARLYADLEAERQASLKRKADAEAAQKEAMADAQAAAAAAVAAADVRTEAINTLNNIPLTTSLIPQTAQTSNVSKPSTTTTTTTVTTAPTVSTTNLNNTTSYAPTNTTQAKVDPVPTQASTPVTTPPPPPVKTAPIDTILFNDESVPIEVMSDLIFEDIGGHEIINIARNDTVNGQEISYQPIKNLSTIQQQYNPNNIVSLQNTSDKYFANFAIKLETKLPEEGGGPDAAYVYIEQDTGDLIVELINLEPDEQIEVQISLSGTIYEAEFNESW